MSSLLELVVSWLSATLASKATAAAHQKHSTQTVYTDLATWIVSFEDIWLPGVVIDKESRPKHWLVIAALVQMSVAVVCWIKTYAQEGQIKGLEPCSQWINCTEHVGCTQPDISLLLCGSLRSSS